MDTSLNYLELQNIAGNKAERLAYVDFKVHFTGSIKRSDLNVAFGLADASASRLLSDYAELRPQNLYRDPSRKVNAITESFQPLIDIDPVIALGMLSHGFNKNKLIDSPVLPYARIGALANVLEREDVAKITRAMFNSSAIECHYISSNSNNHQKREILPLSLLFDGRYWIFRGYQRCEQRPNKFKNFNFSRTTLVSELEVENKQLPHESLTADSAWNEKIPLVLALHPQLSEDQKKSVRKDFGMSIDSEELILTERAALLWILKRRWFIDTADVIASGGHEYYNFYLKNREMCIPYV
ncbi:WYL domain-containing protein [Aliamphritea spongicola]|uniref:WYL domain-containing protein n=1 Tax=Aliamphritea spongicola TaxID=707589 RepID=UPI00196AE7BF|nr:WYL domain-containing protein [Aliamphritea spongicola]MBN3563184.1 WYL domain-containing protein [Aliamphritea spongicola]